MQEDLEHLVSLISQEKKLKPLASHEILLSFQHRGQQFQMDSFVLGTTEPTAPCFFVVGGVHGLERIGAQLCLSLLRSSIERLIWDQTLLPLLERIRIVFVPLVNPVGYYRSTRSNGNGVDLMRNAPVEAQEKVPFLLGGHRFSNILPWYRGEAGKLEAEAQALMDKFHKECSHSSCVVSMDFHSGFGLKDRLWFPYSKTRKPFENLPEMHAFTQLFEQTHPYHIYQIEPQGHGYLLHGDLWDHLYKEFLANQNSIFLPFTLEMGSWSWVKKNPWQLISKDGLFNPVKEHRVKRTYRRHHILFDFVLRALYSHQVWSQLSPTSRHKHQGLAMERWYGR